MKRKTESDILVANSKYNSLTLGNSNDVKELRLTSQNSLYIESSKPVDGSVFIGPAIYLENTNVKKHPYSVNTTINDRFFTYSLRGLLSAKAYYSGTEENPILFLDKKSLEDNLFYYFNTKTDTPGQEKYYINAMLQHNFLLKTIQELFWSIKMWVCEANSSLPECRCNNYDLQCICQTSTIFKSTELCKI